MSVLFLILTALLSDLIPAVMIPGKTGRISNCLYSARYTNHQFGIVLLDAEQDLSLFDRFAWLDTDPANGSSTRRFEFVLHFH